MKRTGMLKRKDIMYGDVSYGDETYGDETIEDETYGDLTYAWLGGPLAGFCRAGMSDERSAPGGLAEPWSAVCHSIARMELAIL